MARRLLIVLVVSVMALAGLPVAPVEAMVSPSPFEVRRDGNTYHAESQTTSSSYSGDLKSVVESATGELMAHGGGVVTFLAGDFDLGPDWFEFTEITDVTFEGQGIDVTTIRNDANASTDTEPFDMTRSDRITVRDMTVHADGPARNTSDALDFDGGDDILIERVKVTGARGRGIIFDGKDAGQTATNNVVRDCIVMDVPADGIQLLASSDNLIENCTITNVGGMGIRVTKSSTSADQPNKKSNDNVISNNLIELAGSHGIGIRASDRNVVTANTVLNSLNGNSGILIAEANGIRCDDNIVQFNTATDNQSTPTQEFGLNISHPECRRTIVIDNNFSGNLLGDINDDGTDTIYTSADEEPPSAPQNLTATAVTGVSVDLEWDASTDNLGITAYDVYRSGTLIGSVNGMSTAYQDTTVAPLTSYQYVVHARDPGGNDSGPSNTVDVTTGAPPPIFTLNPTDDATLRPNRGVLGAEPTLEVDASSVKDIVLRFDVNAVGTSSVVNATLRLRAEDGSPSGGTFVEMTETNWSEDTITWENAPPGDGLTLGSLGSVASGNWYELDVTALVTGDGPIAIRISSSNANGADYASKEGTPGFAPELVIELDEPAPPDDVAPTPPGNLTATDVQPSSVSMHWDASTDAVGVVGYDVYRNGILFDSVDGLTTSYQDTTVQPDTSYTYEVVARDAAGNVSDPSNQLAVTTPAQPAQLVMGAADDATIRENRPDRNLGSASTLEVDASSKKDTLLRFEVTGIGTATVVRATVRLYVVDGSPNGGEWTATTATTWSEDTVTWSSAPAADGSFLGSLGAVSPGTWVELDITSLVAGDGEISLRGSSPNANGADFVSKEGTAGFAPELVIDLG